MVPIRIELDRSTNFCALHVTNSGQDPVAVQVRGFAWSQDADGSDRLDPADIRVNPSIMELTPGQKRLVRCSLPPHAGPVESTFRLLVDEIPRGSPPPGTMQTVLRLSLPVFRKPPGAAVPLLGWRAGPSGTLEIVNKGRMHAIVAKLVVTRPGLEPEKIERGFYILAGARRLVSLSSDAGTITRVETVTGAGKVELVAKLGD